LAHHNDALVPTGGFIEYVLTQGPAAIEQYIKTCRDIGFDILEISSDFIKLAPLITAPLASSTRPLSVADVTVCCARVY
jgi:phosphosulfolactate synthase (CoM biosynthesis protein A)